jgi:hypothetical protein
MSCCGLTPLMPAALGNPVELVLTYPDLQIAIVSTLAVLAAGFALALRREVPATSHAIRQRLQAVWNPGEPPRVVTPLRRGVGGTTGRVPPRSAAGSTSPRRLAVWNGARRR